MSQRNDHVMNEKKIMEGFLSYLDQSIEAEFPSLPSSCSYAEHEIRIKVSACGICRTDLHVIEGELHMSDIPALNYQKHLFFERNIWHRHHTQWRQHRRILSVSVVGP